jgi:TetR/AcrR family fatty acid metabolism transcriptional regulator
LEAALNVFAENGFNGTHISKIAKEANVADGTIYLHFKNKEDLFVAIFRESLAKFVDNLSRQIQDAKTADQAIYILCKTHFADLEQNVHLAYMNQIELRQISMELRKTIGLSVRPYFQLIEQILQRGIDEGSFRADLNIKLTRRLIFGGIDEVVSSWLLSGRKYPLTSQVDETVKFFLKGLK